MDAYNKGQCKNNLSTRLFDLLDRNIEEVKKNSATFSNLSKNGGVAQMVERSLSMREVPGSIPGASNNYFCYFGLWLSQTN